jgi:AraC-like DNA-binding protein
MLKCGDAVFLAPGIWLVTFLKGSFTSLVLSVQTELTRYCLSNFDENRLRHKSVPLPLKEFGHRHVYPHGLKQEGRWACEQILKGQPRVSEDRTLIRLAELIALECVEILNVSQPKEFRRAFIRWQAACQFIEANCHRPINRETVAAHLRMHPVHISRLFKTEGKCSVTDYLRTVRLRRARQLLQEPGLTITEVAALSGFTSQSYFNRVFTKTFGRPPGAEQNHGQ